MWPLIIILNLLQKPSLVVILFLVFLDHDEHERFICPVRTLGCYLYRTIGFNLRCRSLFVSPHCPTRYSSKNAIAFFL